MHTRSLAFVLTSILALAGFAGCGSSNNNSGNGGSSATPAAKSQRGESCQYHGDCDTGLSCQGNVCIPGVYSITPSAKQCVAIQCQTPSDCPGCAGGAQCQYVCTNNQCIPQTTCQQDFNCNPPTSHCNNGTCVECVTAIDCPIGDSCSNGVCLVACTKDTQCPDLLRCVNGVCGTPGCKSNTECINYTHEPLSTCTDGKCAVPCQRDLECNTGGQFDFQVCQSGSCVDIGCQSDKECQLRYDPMASGQVQYVCETPPATP